jgi:hypothetical protein
MQLWDEAEHSLSLHGWTHPERRHHSRSGENGCTPGDAEDCPACVASARARDAYREALFAEMAQLREERSSSRA